MPRKDVPPKASATESMEKALTDAAKKKYVLRLYVTGMTRRSQEAIRNVEKICRERLHGNCDLEVIDIYQQPNLAKGDQIIAVPTLIKKVPLPLRRLIGDLSKEERVLMGLDLKAVPFKKKDEEEDERTLDSI